VNVKGFGRGWGKGECKGFWRGWGKGGLLYNIGT